MIRTGRAVAHAVLGVLCLALPTVAETAPSLEDPIGPAAESAPAPLHLAFPPAGSQRHPPAPAAPAAPISTANPLWAVPLSSLNATRERPLFTPSRRPPAPAVASAPAAPVRAAPPPPAAPDRPSLALVGTVAREDDRIAVFLDQSTRATVRLHLGEGHMGWILHSVERSAVTLQKGEQIETLELPNPSTTQGQAGAGSGPTPVGFPAPPPAAPVAAPVPMAASPPPPMPRPPGRGRPREGCTTDAGGC